MRIPLLLIVLLTGTAMSQDLEARMNELEARVNQLEAMLETPAPPATTSEVDGFTFTRLNLRESSIGYELLGEVTGQTENSYVAFRFTLYDEAGNILETGLIPVSDVGRKPRTFSANVVTDHPLEAVEVLAWQVESAR